VPGALAQRPVGDTHPVGGLGVLDARLLARILRMAAWLSLRAGRMTRSSCGRMAVDVGWRGSDGDKGKELGDGSDRR